MNARTFRGLIAIAVTLSAGACIEDPTAPAEGEILALSDDEARLLGLTVVSQAFDVQLASSVDGGALEERSEADAGSAPLAAQETFEGSETVEVECPEGGTVRAEVSVAGSADDETGELDFDFTIVKTHDACRIVEDDFRAVINGRPSLTTTFSFRIPPGGGVLQITGSLTGGIGVETADGEGECQLDISITGTIETGQTEPTESISGTVCGVPVASNGGG